MGTRRAEIDRRAEAIGKIQNVLLQVNIAGESTKFGCDAVSAPGLASIRTLAASAMDAGAAGVMVAPPGHLRTDDQIYSYFDSVAETLGATPFALQDYPLATQVQISPKVILRIVEALQDDNAIPFGEFHALAMA